MDTNFTGTRDKRGDWQPDKPLRNAPLLIWPTRPLAILRWLFGWPGFFCPGVSFIWWCRF